MAQAKQGYTETYARNCGALAGVFTAAVVIPSVMTMNAMAMNDYLQAITVGLLAVGLYKLADSQLKNRFGAVSKDTGKEPPLLRTARNAMLATTIAAYMPFLLVHLSNDDTQKTSSVNDTPVLQIS